MDNITVSLPLERVAELYNSVLQHDKDQSDIIQLRREIEGLRALQFDCFQLLGDLRKSVAKLQK